ncbi:transglycosylase domain-containing protein [Nocardioides sp. NPDC057767]|uniref:transglycosylase domain-containing protein n=1 Tax=unclassified Nocardioides TaxID=2615069 RepID=UPI003671B3C2
MTSMSSPSLRPQTVLKHLVVMCGVAAVLGVVAAGLAIPFAGVAGIAAKETAEKMDSLPKAFEVDDMSQTTKIVDRKGNLITTLYDQNRVYRPLDQISSNMTKALLAIEDYRFYQHGAMDLKGTLRALITNQASDSVQGGSSITQQLVKTTLVYSAKTEAERKAAIEKSTARKIRELRYAIALEEQHSKDWILERYLNAAYFGDGAYGVQAAAKHYFNVNASELNWQQSAMLAGMVKNPTGYDPTNYPDATIARRNVVIDRMAALKVVSRPEAEKLKDAGLGLNVQKQRNGCLGSSAEFFCDYVIKWLLKDPAFGENETDRLALIKSGGLTIKTTLDQRFQDAAQESVEDHVYATDQAIGALAMVEPGTGRVRALAQSRPMGDNKKKGQSYLNYLVPKEKAGDSNGFQAGSTFKAFTLAAAIEQGFPLKQQINSPEELTLAESTFAGCPGDGRRVGTHTFHNSTTSGSKDAYTGTRESVNTFYAQLFQLTGMCTPYKMAQKMGIKLTAPFGVSYDDGHLCKPSETRCGGAERVPTFTLGVVDVSPLEMAEAYATFGARGKHCDSVPVNEILDANGKVLKTYKPTCEQAMAKGTADAVNDILRGVMEGGGFAANQALSVPSAGKTGTTQEGKAVWLMGYTPRLATAAMIAGANSKGTPLKLGGQYVGGDYIATASGSGFAGPMWGDAMKVIDKYLKWVDFQEPDPNVIAGRTVDVPWTGGMTVEKATKVLRNAGFQVQVGPEAYSEYDRGLVAFTTPSGDAAEGSPVTIYTSLGPEPKPEPKKKKKQPEESAPPPEEERQKPRAASDEPDFGWEWPTG